MEVTMNIVKGQFTNDKGETLEYIQGIAEVCGERVRFVCKKEDKTLLNYLLKGQKLDTIGSASEVED